MGWYRAGTVTVASGSTAVAGVQTLWASQAKAGDLFTLDGDKFYEIDTIADDTHLTLKTAFQGNSGSVLSYAIVRNFTATLPAQLASQLADLMTSYHVTLDELTAWLSGSGTVTVHDGAGNAYQVKTPAQLSAEWTGLLTKSVAGSGDVTLTTTEAANAFIVLTGTLSGARNVIVPTSARRWIIVNNTTGAFALTVKTATGTGRQIAQGGCEALWCDGTNVRRTDSDALKADLAGATFTGPVKVPNLLPGATGADAANADFVNTAVAAKESLQAMSQSIHAGTVVKAFLYDTGKDSDGGAWRKRCADKSWYNEPLVGGKWLGQAASEAGARAIAGAATGDYFQNTADGKFYALNASAGVTEVFRGNTREFPELVAVLGEATRLILYDLTKPDCPMWMVFARGTAGTLGYGGSITGIAALNGEIVFSTDQRLMRLQFTADRGKQHHGAAASCGYYAHRLAERNTVLSSSFIADAGVPTLASSTVNAIAAIVLPDAPVDLATGMPAPTIGAACSTGFTVLRQDGTGTTVTVTNNNIGWILIHYPYVTVDATGNSSHFISGYDLRSLSAHTISTIDATDAQRAFQYKSAGGSGAGNAYFLSRATSAGAFARQGNNFALGDVNGLYVMRDNPGTPAKGMAALISNAFNAGWMPFDTRGAWLADCVAETLTASAVDPDRSVKATGLTVNGSIVKSAVASGAQLVAYSGFSDVNYLSQAYSANFDFGTGDFHIAAWVNLPAGGATGAILDRYDPAQTGARLYLGVSGTNWILICAAGNTPISTGVAPPVGLAKVDYLRVAGTLKLYVDGVLVYSAANTANVTNTAAPLIVGHSSVTVTAAWPGSLSLLRISATALSDDQIAYAYNTERMLFQPAAKCTIDGTSTAVTALAYDDNEDALHVGTSWGRSKFRDLVRIESAATSVGSISALSAGQGAHITAGAGGGRFYQPALLLRDELRRKDEARRALGRVPVFLDFDAATGQTAFTLPKGYTARAVYSGGTLKRFGTTKDYTISSDGFAETVNFAVAPGNAVWVSIMATRSNG